MLNEAKFRRRVSDKTGIGLLTRTTTNNSSLKWSFFFHLVYKNRNAMRTWSDIQEVFKQCFSVPIVYLSYIYFFNSYSFWLENDVM